MKTRTKIWRVIAKSLGEKNGSTDREADMVALLRFAVMLNIIICNIFIIVSIIHKW
jgi:hypothetical protein